MDGVLFEYEGKFFDLKVHYNIVELEDGGYRAEILKRGGAHPVVVGTTINLNEAIDILQKYKLKLYFMVQHGEKIGL